jgi:hypothetical protein
VPILIESAEEIDRHVAQLRTSAANVHSWLAAQTCDPFELLRRIKFDAVGFHPIESRSLNLIEQVNQTWTYAVALEATRKLFELHPDARGFRLSPGAFAELKLDIMSVQDDLVGAETFAAVDHRNNRKLASDLNKLARPEFGSLKNRYVFFMSSEYRTTERRPELERDGIRVWSVDVRADLA